MDNKDDIIAELEFENSILTEKYQNLMNWMVKHPNNNLEKFMERHVPESILAKRQEHLEKTEMEYTDV